MIQFALGSNTEVKMPIYEYQVKKGYEGCDYCKDVFVVFNEWASASFCFHAVYFAFDV